MDPESLWRGYPLFISTKNHSDMSSNENNCCDIDLEHFPLECNLDVLSALCDTNFYLLSLKNDLISEQYQLQDIPLKFRSNYNFDCESTFLSQVFIISECKV